MKKRMALLVQNIQLYFISLKTIYSKKAPRIINGLNCSALPTKNTPADTKSNIKSKSL